jgi:hypothetical protein
LILVNILQIGRNLFIILIHKAGDKLDINNYSGISLQNCIAKLFSAVINCKIVTYYEDKFACSGSGLELTIGQLIVCLFRNLY